MGSVEVADDTLVILPEPIALIEAKDNNHSVGSGMQQGIGYAETLDVPFVFSSNGDGFLFHDRSGTFGQMERTLTLDEFPSPEELWAHYKQWKGLETADEALVTSPNHAEAGGKDLRVVGVHRLELWTSAV